MFSIKRLIKTCFACVMVHCAKINWNLRIKISRIEWVQFHRFVSPIYVFKGRTYCIMYTVARQERFGFEVQIQISVGTVHFSCFYVPMVRLPESWRQDQQQYKHHSCCLHCFFLLLLTKNHNQLWQKCHSIAG